MSQDVDRPRRPPPADVRWQIHDVAVGFMAGLSVGYVVGIFIGVHLIEDPVVPFVVGAIGAVVGVMWLLRAANRGKPMVLRRVVAWVLLVLATAFMVMLAVAIATFE